MAEKKNQYRGLKIRTNFGWIAQERLSEEVTFKPRPRDGMLLAMQCVEKPRALEGLKGQADLTVKEKKGCTR